MAAHQKEDDMNNDEMSAESAYMVGDDIYTEEQFAALKRNQVEALHSTFSKMRDKWITHRAMSGVEIRWRKATDLYFGGQDASVGTLEDTLRNGPSNRKPTDGPRSKVVVNIVRPKIDQAIARMCEIILPVDDKNWGIRPTPVPEIANMTGDQRATVDPTTGQPTGMTAHEEAKVVIEAAKKSADAMEKSIDDALTECNYNGESRKLIENAVRLGSGIMYGPFPARQTSKCWHPLPDGTQYLQVNESIVPASESLDPWNVWFDPACGNNHQRGRGFYIKRDVTRKELRSLIGLPGYDADAVRAVLQSAPCRVRVAEGRVMRDTIVEDSYEMWTYHGEIEPEDMHTLSEKAGDPIEDVDFGVLVMVNDKIIGAMESWVVDKSLPVDVWCWRKADDSPYGHGLPDELEHQQRVVNSAWRQVMDNGRTSLGGQIVMKKGMIIPQNGSYDITPNKVWLAKDDLDDVRSAMTVFEFNSHLQELLAIAQAAMAFADTESNMPQIMGGQQGSAPQTVGGMVMLFNNANVVPRQRVKLYDDMVTKPHIGRYYDWKMANDTDPDIKGDYEVDARGSSALIERDIQNQALLNLASITNNPRYTPHLKEREELKAILKAFKVNPDELMKDEEEVKQEMAEQAKNGAPQDPRMAAAQMNMQAKQLDMQDRDKQRQFEADRNDKDMELRRETLQYNSAREASEANIAATDAQLSRELAIAKMNQDGEMTQDQLRTKERLEMIKISDGRERFNAEAAIKVRQGSGI